MGQPSLSTSLPQVPLSNMFEALAIERDISEKAQKGLPKALPRTRQATLFLCDAYCPATAKKDKRVIVVGDSLLMVTEAPVCRPGLTHWEMCCLLGPGSRA